MNEADEDIKFQHELIKLAASMDYEVLSENGQRRFGVREKDYRPPPKGCELFFARIPRSSNELELVPLFSQFGKFYEMRIMLTFSKKNRGFGFVKYFRPEDARKAREVLNGQELKLGQEVARIGVCKSLENHSLLASYLNPLITVQDIKKFLADCNVTNVVNVTINGNEAIIDFAAHRDAALARRQLTVPNIKSKGYWDHVDWKQSKSFKGFRKGYVPLCQKLKKLQIKDIPACKPFYNYSFV